ncbi:oxysterol-binding protein-related protein 1-like isoform X3 [Physella acuta]|uniref:oxysterol-binding protein-related protein 1-like isoform X3 n=1 Tax=Physella acuta TaxID=109671 RepID=UPI0027DC4F9E|nr:oxysterol-binding protein-related protein 1-like isoform X3 [Physella acuta]
MSSGDSTNDVTSGSESDDSSVSFSSPEEELLSHARNGQEDKLLHLLISTDGSGNKLDINCKGEQKSNRGWTPLHLAAYFGQTSAVRLLLEFGAIVDVLNTSGESPLHLSAYTGREEVVALLLQHGADTGIVNTLGQTAADVTNSQHIKDMLEAAKTSDNLKIQSEFLQASALGDTEHLARLLGQARCLNVNTQDKLGNSALHLAALRGHGTAAAFLLQHGIDSSLRNVAGLTAYDVAQNVKVKQILGLQPIKSLQSHPQRFEGVLLKKSRFGGFKPMWVVLERGVLSYFVNRGDASTGSHRKGMEYLDEAKVVTSSANPNEFRLEFSDGSRHTLQVVDTDNGCYITLQKWLSALSEHIAYSNHYIHQMEQSSEDTADNLLSLGTMQEALQTARAHRGHVEKQVQILQDTLTSLTRKLAPDALINKPLKQADLQAVTAQTADILTSQTADILTSQTADILTSQTAEILKSSQDMLNSLSHCLILLTQQEELRQGQLTEERERCRVLQDSLHALATEHHELERSFSRRQSFLSMDEEFFDCPDAGSPVMDAFADAISQDSAADDVNRENGQSFGRTKLPVPMFSRADFSFWSILKQCIGKELSKITMPVVFNEPLSFIQRLAEYLEYAPLIEKATTCDNPVERMEYVTAFAVSALSSNWERIGKPFNPLLGETFELDRPDLGFRFIGEQVSHHPPITAVHAEGRGYCIHGSIQPKLKFWGKTVEINPKGIISLELYKYKETYTWQNVNCCIHNVIVGSLWVEHYGTMEIACNTSSIKAVLNFKQSGWFAKDLHHVEGYIFNGKKKERALYGSWVLGMYSSPADVYDKFINDTEAVANYRAKHEKKDAQKMTLLTYNYQLQNQKTIWLVNPRPPHSSDYYHFSLFAMTLNELLPGMKQALPPTDSRFRPDIRSMEEGKIDQSAEEKNRVEEKQREARKERKKRSKEWQPRWFTLTKSGGREDWVFNPTYWQKNWKDCADIF